MDPVFRRLVAVLALVLAGSAVRAQEAEAPATVPTGPWFDDVGTPLRLSAQHGAALCRMAWNGLRSGQPGERRPPAEGTPRAVFVSWSDGVRSAEVAHGLGIGPVDALRDTLGRIPAGKFPLDALRCLKVDVVQTVLTIPRQVGDKEIPGFYARESILPLPSLFGVAFPHSSGLAFLPDELVGRSMLDPLGRLSGASFSSRLAREGRIEDVVRWGRMVGLPVSQRVSFFETQAWFYDGTVCVPLYRGHRFYEDLASDEVRGIAVNAAGRLSRLIDDKGRIPPPFPQWFGTEKGRLRPFDAALTILALAEAAHLSDEPAPLVAAAERLAAPMVKALRRADKEGRMLCLVEQDEDEERQSEWPVVRLSTNALSALALCRLARHGEATRFDAPLGGLARYLLSQYQEGGGFLGQRRLLSTMPPSPADRTDGGIAVCAMVALYEKTNERIFWTVAIEAFRAMLPGARKTPMGQLATDEWFLRAADVCFTYSREPECVVQAQRYALGLVAQQDRHPVFPDMFGAVKRLPSATASASQTGLIASAARLCFDSGSKAAGRDMLAHCRSSLVAQLQGYVTEAEAMYLDTPPQYRGLFRDHVRGFGFDIQSQYVQILSLCELAKAMERVGLERLRDDKLEASRKIDEEMAAARLRAEQFPGLLGMFDGMLERHRIVVPERSTEPRAPRAPITPAEDWHAPRPGAAGDDAGLPVVRPVRPPQ